MLLFTLSCNDSALPELSDYSGYLPSSRIGPVPKEFFGMHIHRADSGTPWPTARIGSWRLWDAYSGWPDLEPEPGKWNFELLDKYVAMAKLAGTEILLPLGRTPRWASSRPDERSSYGSGQAAEPVAIEDWSNYVRTVATRYKGRIRAYEIWNEANEKGFFSGTPEALIELQREAYRILKEIDPGVVVVMPAAVHAYKWVDNYLALGGGRYADVIGYHFYVPKEAPESILREVAAVRALLAKHRLAGKPLWNTETGWWIANTDGTPEGAGVDPSWKRLQPEEGAAYVARALILGRWAGLERFYWYAWDNRSLGLVEPRSRALKPAGQAYGKVAEWLTGAELLGCLSSGPVWRCETLNVAGERAWLAWSVDGGGSWEVPAGWRIKAVERLNGDLIEFVPGAIPARVPVGAAPQRIVVGPTGR